jgi:hypothetical protein
MPRNNNTAIAVMVALFPSGALTSNPALTGGVFFFVRACERRPWALRLSHRVSAELTWARRSYASN